MGIIATARAVTARSQGTRTPRTVYLLSPFLRCGKCSARMIGSHRRNRRGELEEIYRCPARGNGGCGGVTRGAEPVNKYVTALVIAESQNDCSTTSR